MPSCFIANANDIVSVIIDVKQNHLTGATGTAVTTKSIVLDGSNNNIDASGLLHMPNIIDLTQQVQVTVH